jgi:Putative collagen-binding domain of a collagenase
MLCAAIALALIGSDFEDTSSASGVDPDTTEEPSEAPSRAMDGPLRVLPTNSRYFTDNSGRAIFLTGSHSHPTIQDRGDTDPPRVFDYSGFLDFLEQHNHNFTRLWAWEETQDPTAAGLGLHMAFTSSPTLWMRTGPGTALDGKPKFDLTQPNPAYLNHLRSRVIAARDRGVYVSIMLFQGWSLEHKGVAGRDPWSAHPFNRNNNVNGIDGDLNRDGQGIEVHTLAMPAVTALQTTYVRAVIDAVNDLDNVVYEITNESPSESKAWQYSMTNRIRDYELTKPKQHPVGMTAHGPPWENAGLYASPAQWISLAGVDPHNPPATDGRKVSIQDDDHSLPNWWDRISLWKSFLRGHNLIALDPVDRDWPTWGLWVGMGSGPGRTADSFEAVRQTMGHTLGYAEKMNLAAMVPRNDLASTGYCLAHPGSEYLVYQPASGDFTVNLAAGTYRAEWFNPLTGSDFDGASFTTGGGRRSFTPPFEGDALLYLRSNGQAPPPPRPLVRRAGPLSPRRSSSLIGLAPTVSFAGLTRSARMNSRGVFTFVFRASPPRANGRLSLSSASKVLIAKKPRTLRRLELGRGRFTVPASALVRIKVKLSRNNRRILRRRKRIRIVAKGAIDGKTFRHRFVLKAPE